MAQFKIAHGQTKNLPTTLEEGQVYVTYDNNGQNGKIFADVEIDGETTRVALEGLQGPQGVSGVWTGSGEAPEGYDIQIDVSGEPTEFLTITNITESTVDGGSNVVTFSNGSTLTVKNGNTGAPGVDGKDYILTDADMSEITRLVIESLGGNPIFGYVDENNNIIVSGNLADGDYTLKYEMEDGSFIIVGELVLDTNVYYSITKNLTNCSISNSASTVVEGESYSATISANDGYELKSVTATMGGSSVSVTNGVINITSVTGNIVITAVAEKIITPTYTNLADSTSADWQEGYRLSISTGTTSKLEGHTTTNFIRVKSGDVLRVKGLRIVDTSDTSGGTSASPKIVKYTIDKAKQSGAYGTVQANSGQSYGTSAVINGDVTTLTLLVCNDGVNYSDENLAYIRIDGFLMDGYTSKDVIITKNEEII